jgi:dipeptidyl aminopeptidase/acylaminoacyl peptidase
MRVPFCRVVLLPLSMLVTACSDDTTEPGTGGLELSITTTGRDFDQDGYAVTVDAGSSQPVPINGTLSIPALSAGEHTAILTGLATNCTPATPASLQVQIPEQGTARFEVSCAQIYTLAYEGAAGVELTNAAGTVHRTLVPDAKPLGWSPDGQLLAVVQRQDPYALWLISPDSGGLHELIRLEHPPREGIRTVKWAPDGRELLYEVVDGPNSFPAFLERVALDGSFDGYMDFVVSGEEACSHGVQAGTAPDWSPDGQQVVVHSDGLDLFILTRDGSGQRLLVGGQQPDWSPDGSVIAFVAGPSQCDAAYATEPVRHASSSLHLIGPDGNSERQLTHPSPDESDEDPVWSPDGSTVAFVRLGVVGPDRRVTSVAGYLVDADGTNERQLAALPLPDPIVVYRPSWSADGLHLAFAGPAGIFVVGADGSAFHTVSEAVTRWVPAQWRP